MTKRCIEIDELQAVLEERDGGNNDFSELLDQLKAEKAQKRSEMQIAVTASDTAFAGHQRLQREICQLQQQLESTNTALQDQVL
jgi:ABC-type phosphate transport system auxiliary subunit